MYEDIFFVDLLIWRTTRKLPSAKTIGPHKLYLYTNDEIK